MLTEFVMSLGYIALYILFLYIKKSPSRELRKSTTDSSFDPLKCSRIRHSNLQYLFGYITLYILFFLYIKKSPSRQLSKSSTDSSFDPLKCSRVSDRVTCNTSISVFFFFLVLQHDKECKKEGTKSFPSAIAEISTHPFSIVLKPFYNGTLCCLQWDQTSFI